MTAGRLVNWKTFGLAAAVLAIGALLAVVFLVNKAGPTTAGAADHLDAPGATAPPGGDGIGTDLTDVYAFQSPSDASKTVLIMNVNGLMTAIPDAQQPQPPGPDRPFATKVPQVDGNSKVSYYFRVDSNGDARPDVNIQVRFGKPRNDGSQEMDVKVLNRSEDDDEIEFEGRSTGFGQTPVVNRGPRHIKFFAGRRDDPFFFDLFGFLNILDFSGRSLANCATGLPQPRPNEFKNQNVSSIVLELPSRLLEGGGDSKIGVWATTNVGESQIDRMGRPAINTVFIPNNPIPPDNAGPSKKTTFNHGQPSTDVATWKPEVVNTLATLFSLNNATDPNVGDDAGKIDGLANFLLPDILTIDVSSTTGFPNGRQLADDVIDTELGLITEGLVTTDCVANDSTFLSGFPYAGNPN